MWTFSWHTIGNSGIVIFWNASSIYFVVSAMQRVWHGPLSRNLMPLGKEFIRKCIRQIGSGIPRYYALRILWYYWPDIYQMALPVRSILVPVIFASDTTHLTNFSSDGKLGPVYMSIGNILSRIRQKPTSHAWIPVVLLPVVPKRVHKKAGWSAVKQERESLEIMHVLLKFILGPISDAAEDGITARCGDGVVRKCYIRVAAWLGDHIENCTIHAIYNTRYGICECLTTELGNHGHSNRRRDHEIYKQWVQEEDTEQLKAAGVKLVWNALWTLRDVSPTNLIRPDLLHNMFLGIVEYLMDWIEGFRTVHNRLNAFDDIWAQMPAYPGNHVPHKPYRSLSQVQGKEMRAILRVLLAVFMAALHRKTNVPQVTGGQQQEFKKAILCVRYITDFGLIARYHSHTDSIVKYMRTYLRKFYESKDVFLRYRAGKKAQRRAEDISKQLTEEIDQRRATDIGLSAAQLARLVEDD